MSQLNYDPVADLTGDEAEERASVVDQLLSNDLATLDGLIDSADNIQLKAYFKKIVRITRYLAKKEIERNNS